MLVEVKNKEEAKAFIGLPYKIYRNDPQWIAPPDVEVKAVFNPAKNSFFNHGDCKRWILLNEKQDVIGRIAAFFDSHKITSAGQATGGVGFFECINDEIASHQLFDKAKEWIKSNCMSAMDGPINFGENDMFWGLLINGFSSPSYGMNYNPPYYALHFESYGFVKAYDQITNVLDVSNPLPERFTRISDWVLSKKDYSFEHFTFGNKEKYFLDFKEIYDDAWKDFENFSPMDVAVINESFKKMKAVIDNKIIWFAYHGAEPIAFILCLPDVNQILKHLNGKMHFRNKLKFIFYKYLIPITRLRIIVMGCKRKFQNHGIESALIRCLKEEVLPRNTIKEVELAWVGDFNKKMRALHKATGAKQMKVHRTYKYIFA
jgi:hypothetical protein